MVEVDVCLVGRPIFERREELTRLWSLAVVLLGVVGESIKGLLAVTEIRCLIGDRL